jgi:hypothetical protein
LHAYLAAVLSELASASLAVGGIEDHVRGAGGVSCG